MSLCVQGLKPHRASLDFNKRKRWHEKHGGEQIPPRSDLKNVTSTAPTPKLEPNPNSNSTAVSEWVSG